MGAILCGECIHLNQTSVAVTYVGYNSLIQKIGTHSVHVGSRKKDQLSELTKLVIWDITLNALFFPFMFAPPANLTFWEF